MKKFNIFMALFFTGVIIVSMYAQAESNAASNPITGKIVETMDSGGYTYILLDQGGEKIWVAIGKTSVSVGQEIALAQGHEMLGFTSNTLNRTFDRIIFSTGIVSKTSPSGQESPSTTLGSKGGMTSVDKSIKEEKASGENAYTVAELYAKCGELDQKNVLLRGRVVKLSQNIMGKNWLHIQDGSGSQETNTHDIVVTTQDVPSVGDVVVVNGTLFKDKDFGSGYKYNVIVEQASIKKE